MSIFAGPAEVRGNYEKIRNILHPILIAIFIALPWVKVGGQPIFLFDILNRHFVLLGVTFYSHDAPLLFFVLILTVLAVFILTAVFGRIWCGWACPQTVFIHSVFNKVEQLVLGKFANRAVFYKSEGSLSKTFKIGLIYFLFILISWVLSHSFIAYFLGADVVTRYIADGPFAHTESFLLLTVMTLLIFGNFGMFRERFCFLVCPYGRFQNALIDNNSLTVYYDTVRGEPRGKIRRDLNEEQGDCIDCKMCVRACPTKIDIRNGFQMECIACGKCIDACNEVMAKVKKPAFLIRYDTGNKKKINLKRFRLFLYAILFTVFFAGFVYLLANRSLVEFALTRNPTQPFSNRLENEKKIYVNQFNFHLKNNTGEVTKVETVLPEETLKKGFSVSSPAVNLELSGGQDIKVPLFIESRSDLTKEPIEVRLKVYQKNDNLNGEPQAVYKKTVEFLKVE